MSPAATRTVVPAKASTVARPPVHRPKPLPARVVSPLQRKPVIGAVDDPLEREADRVADAVVAGQLAIPISGAPLDVPQRKCAACEAAEEHGDEPCEDCCGGVIRRASDGGDSILLKAEGSTPHESGASAAAQAVAAGGTPMPATLRTYFEPRFGRGFEDVRLHTNGAGSNASRAIHARAYTLGSAIAFAPGAYAPDSLEGRRLIAHELAHVAQQEGGLPPVIRRQTEGDGGAASTEADIKELTREEERDAEIRGSRSSPGGVRTSTEPFRITLDDFAVDSDDLKRLHEGALGELLDILKSAPAGRLRVVIVGHADETGADAHNLGLSRRRALAAMRRLRGARGTSVEALGLGEAQPAAPNSTVEGRKRNRRVEIFVLPGPSVEVSKPEPDPKPDPVPTDDDKPDPPEDKKPPEEVKPPPGKTERPPEKKPPEKKQPEDDRWFCERHPIICGAVGVGVGVGTGILFCIANPAACVPLPVLPRILPPGGSEPPGGDKPPEDKNDPDKKDPDKKDPEKEKKKRKPPRACLSSSSLPSGHIRARRITLGKRWLLQSPFTMKLSFSHDPETGCDCSCGEYRQDVKGTFEKDVGAGWVPGPLPRVANGSSLDAGTFQEDAHSHGPYGHRFRDPTRLLPRGNEEGDEFVPDATTGCDYSGSDSPGWNIVDPPPGSKYRFDLRFRGAPVDGCVGRARMTGWNEWRCSGQMDIPGSPPPTPKPDPDPTPTPTPTPAPQMDPAPYRGPSIGPAPPGPLPPRRRPGAGELCIEDNIGCRTLDYIFDHHALLVGDDERDTAINMEMEALMIRCELSRPRFDAVAIAAWRARLRAHAERRIDAFLAWRLQITDHPVGPVCP